MVKVMLEMLALQLMKEESAELEVELEAELEKGWRRRMASVRRCRWEVVVRYGRRRVWSLAEWVGDLVGNYFQSDKPQTIGLPSVRHFAEELHLSANYFGDLVKKETGKPAQEYIQEKVIALAKEKLFDINKSISEIAYEIGFKYPQHFTRLFTQRVGYSPYKYRTMN